MLKFVFSNIIYLIKNLKNCANAAEAASTGSSRFWCDPEFFFPPSDERKRKSYFLFEELSSGEEEQAQRANSVLKEHVRIVLSLRRKKGTFPRSQF